MIKKISISLIFLCLLIAIPLALMGYKKVELGTPGLALLRVSAIQLEQYKVEIPDIPQIPLFNAGGGWLVVLDFLIKVVNGLTTFINFLVDIFNYIIKIIEYIVIIIKNLITFKDSVQPLIIS